MLSRVEDLWKKHGHACEKPGELLLNSVRCVQCMRNVGGLAVRRTQCKVDFISVEACVWCTARVLFVCVSRLFLLLQQHIAESHVSYLNARASNASLNSASYTKIWCTYTFVRVIQYSTMKTVFDVFLPLDITPFQTALCFFQIKKEAIYPPPTSRTRPRSRAWLAITAALMLSASSSSCTTSPPSQSLHSPPPPCCPSDVSLRTSSTLC